MYTIFVAFDIVEEVELFIIAMMVMMILTKTRIRRRLMYIIFVAFYIDFY